MTLCYDGIMCYRNTLHNIQEKGFSNFLKTQSESMPCVNSSDVMVLLHAVLRFPIDGDVQSEEVLYGQPGREVDHARPLPGAQFRELELLEKVTFQVPRRHAGWRVIPYFYFVQTYPTETLRQYLLDIKQKLDFYMKRECHFRLLHFYYYIVILRTMSTIYMS